MSFEILPEDKEFVDRIAAIIPLEAADRDALKTLIAGHRMMHRAASPSGEVMRELKMQTLKNMYLNRIIWALVKRYGDQVSETAEVTVSDSDTAPNWQLELVPDENAKSLKIQATVAPLKS